MTKVFVDVGMSLDGFIAGPNGGLRQYLNGGHVDEITIHVAPVLLGRGVRLFESVDKSRLSIDVAEAIHSPLVTHVRYDVTNK